MSLISGIKIEQYEEYVRVREIEESRVVIDHVMRFSFVDKFYYWKILRLKAAAFYLPLHHLDYLVASNKELKLLYSFQRRRNK